MPYCPSCEAEYQGDVTICPDCNTTLVAELQHHETDEDMVDVFVCYDVPLADRMMLALRNAGITPLVRDHRDHAFPTNIGLSSEQRIAVPATQQARAHAIVQEAVADGLVKQSDGDVVPAP